MIPRHHVSAPWGIYRVTDRRVAQVDIVARAMLACVAAFVVLATLTEDAAGLAMMTLGRNVAGDLPVALLAVAAVLIAADVIVNDLLPARFSLELVARHRAWLYFWTGYCFAYPAFTATTQGLHKPAATWLYATMFIAAMVLGYRHAVAVHRGRVCDP